MAMSYLDPNCFAARNSLHSMGCGFGFNHPLLLLLRLQTIKTIVNSRRFKGSSCEEPRRVQVLDLYCLTRFESKSSSREIVY